MSVFLKYRFQCILLICVTLLASCKDSSISAPPSPTNASSTSATPNAEMDDSIIIVRKFFESYNKQDYENMAELIGYPPELEGKALEDDKYRIRLSLDALYNEFGSILSYHKESNASKYLSIFIAGGDFEWLEGYHETYTITYEVEFKQEGLGSIKFEFTQEPYGKILKKVSFGIPANRPDARTRVHALMEKIYDIMLMEAKRQQELGEWD